MKKFILSIIIILFSVVTINARTYEANCQIVPAKETLLLKNNEKKNFLQDPYLSFSIKLGEDKINFNVFEKIQINNKIFLIGNGSNNVNCICIYDDKICMPIDNARKVMIESKELSSYIMNAVEDVPFSTDHFNGI